jgi:hypothetical protein
MSFELKPSEHHFEKISHEGGVQGKCAWLGAAQHAVQRLDLLSARPEFKS